MMYHIHVCVPYHYKFNLHLVCVLLKVALDVVVFIPKHSSLELFVYDWLFGACYGVINFNLRY